MKAKQYLIQSFFKGTIMFETTLAEKEYEKFREFIKNDWFTLDEVADILSELTSVESSYVTQSSNTGSYEVHEHSNVHMMMINYLIKVGVLQNDNMNGFIVTIS